MSASLLDDLNGLLTVGKAEPFELSEAAAKKLGGLLVPWFGKTELVEIVLELARFAVWIGTEAHSPTAQARMLATLEGAIPALKRLGHDRVALDLEKAAKEKSLAHLVGQERVLLTETEAPEGSIGSGPLARFRLHDQGKESDDKPKAPKTPRRW
ncbi:MAG: hypothetical protein U1E65_34835 [Myxococcota bacterium]